VIDLKKLRTEIGLSQERMGKLLGMPQQAYYRIEKGRRQPTRQIRQAAANIIYIRNIGKLPGLIEKYCPWK